MITAVAHKNLASAEGYFSEHLVQNDYYAAGEVRPGQWVGHGSKRLGLGPDIEREEFLALCENRVPGSTERLTQRQKAAGERRVFYDFTCSAPKSVSILAVTVGDERLVRAHEEAARVAFHELETFAAVRVRKNSECSDRTTGNLVAGSFLHTSSRALDPQLHTHFTVFNASWDPIERRWKALQAGDMYGAVRFATQVYRNELARRIHEIGYKPVNVENWLEVEGVTSDLLKRFSKRAAQRDRMVRTMEERLGRELSKDEVSYAVHRSRAPKVRGISTQEVQKHQRAQLTQAEIANLESLRSSPLSAEPIPCPDEPLRHAMGHVFERRSVVSEHELLEEALSHRLGRVDLKELKSAVRKSDQIIRTDAGITTVDVLKEELTLLNLIRLGKSSLAPIHPLFEPAGHLGQDQRNAVRHLLQNADRVTGIRGWAGSGKTTMLHELARACGEAGVQLRFCAPTAAATDVLRKEGFAAVTLARALQEAPGPNGPVVTVLDEAGAVGTSDMARLLASSERVVLVGDTGQHGSVGRGDALRLIEEHSPFAVAQLTEIRRQKWSAYRRAVEAAADRDPASAWDQLEKIGAIEESSDPQRTAADHYLAAIHSGRQVLLVAPTWKEIEAVTNRCRDGLRSRGILRGHEYRVDTFDSLSWTEAQRRDLSLYRTGYQVRFHLPTGPFSRHEIAEVVETEGRLTLRRADGTLAEIDPYSAARCLDVGVGRSLRISTGEKLLLQANAAGLINGELVDVSKVDDKHIHLTDGRVLPPDYRTFTHGYAVTSHAAQGKTVDEVILVASKASLAAVHREQFYVSISRGRHLCRILTDDRDQLRARIGRSSHRIGAIEATKCLTPRASLIRRAIQWAQQLPVRLQRLQSPHRHVSQIQIEDSTRRQSIRV